MKSTEDSERNLSDHLELVQAIYIDACAKCLADVYDLRDLITIRSRVRHEGLSFLTITMPQFCRDFERSLQDGIIDSTLFRSFKKRSKYEAIPAFLQGMLSQVFDRWTGRIYDDQHTGRVCDLSISIDSIRQVCLAFKKIDFVCAPERVADALTNFITVEHANRQFSPPKEDMDYFCSVSSVLWGNSLVNINLQLLYPKHGPGATAERISGNQKYVWRRWHDRLEPYFPLLGNAYSISANDSEELELVTVVSQEQESPVRVITVPKTMKGPRIIAIEPCCMQYAQQAIRRILYDAIESSEFAAGHVNFRDQSVNQRLAVMSSEDGQYATIDLSDASDRVPLKLALEMFRSNPDLQGAIEACRSESAELPDGAIIRPLSKFASMGSALCFPIESMYFYTICVVALLRGHNLPVSYANVKFVSRNVYVYGDDLIVPQTFASVVLENLQKYNCKVNTSKTFISGKFRESCGVDAYNGDLVTPVYLRKDVPKHRQQAQELISWVATANAFYLKGYWRTTSLMFAHIERILGPLPYVSDRSPGLGRVSLLGYRTAERWNTKFQRLEQRCWVPSAVYRSDGIDGYAALQKSLSTLNQLFPADWVTEGITLDLERIAQRESSETYGQPFRADGMNRDAHHLERNALHGAVTLKRRWVPVF